jgi:hypothetical protein
MPSVATALDIARLYEELRECVRANDQEGVKRVFAELVRARRPVPEILAEVKSLTKEREKLEEREKSSPEKPAFEPREWPVQVARSDTPPTVDSQSLRNLGSAADAPQPAPNSSIAQRAVSEAHPAPRDKPLDQPSAAVTKSAPEPALRRPSESPSFGPEHSASPEPAAKSSPERFGSTPIERPKTGAAPAQTQHPPSASPVAEAPVVTGSATASAASSTTTGAAPAPPQSTSTTPARPQTTAVVGEAKKPDPSPQTSALHQVVARNLAAEASPVASTVSQPFGGIEPRTVPAPSKQIATSAQVSGAALSLRQSLDLSFDESEKRQPARRAPVMALATVAVVIVAIGGSGWFWLSPKPGGQVGVEAAVGPEATASTADTKRQGSPAPRSDAVGKSPEAKPPEAKPPTPAPSIRPTASPTPAIAGARERPPADSAAAPSARNAVVPAPAASPAVAAAPSGTASATPAPPQGDAASATAKLEPSKDAAPTPAAPESASPVAPTPAANAPAPIAPAEPRISAAEAAEMLSQGDAAFGVGDIASARLFYERAADAGSGEAALRLGETYDPNFLERAKLRSVHGDPKAAIQWYRRAKELGLAEADILLKGIQTK